MKHFYINLIDGTYLECHTKRPFNPQEFLRHSMLKVHDLHTHTHHGAYTRDFYYIYTAHIVGFESFVPEAVTLVADDAPEMNTTIEGYS